MAGYDADTQQATLHMVEPNGAAFSYYGVATGKGKQAAKTELEKLNLHKEPIQVQSAVQEICKILYLLHQENKDNEGKPFEVELSWICSESKWRHVGVPKDIIAAGVEWAKEQVEEEEDEDEGMEE